MNKIKILIYSLEFVLSNKYLEASIQYLEPVILNIKVSVLFYKIIKYKIKPQLPHLISQVLNIVY